MHLTIVVSALALGAPPRAVVLPSVIRDEEVQGLLAAEALYDEIFRSLEFCHDLEVIPRDRVETGLLAALSACGSDIGCASERLLEVGIVWAIEAVINARVDPPLLTIGLIDARSRKTERTYVEEIGAGRPLGDLLGEVVDRLVREAGWSIGGRIRVEVKPSDAQISIDPAPQRALETNVFAAPAGVYRVSASREGFADASQQVVVVAREENRVEIALSEDGILGSPWLWVGIAAAVVAAGAVTAGILLAPRDRQLCQANTPEQCP